MVRGMDEAWLKNLYGIALEPDVVFYLNVPPEELVQRNFAKNSALDYWESGMDLGLSRDMFDSFLKYQTLMQKTFRHLQATYGFTIVDGLRSADAINAELRKKIERRPGGQIKRYDPEPTHLPWQKPMPKQNTSSALTWAAPRSWPASSTHSLDCLGTAKVSTKSQRGAEAVVERIARCVRDAVDEADLTSSRWRGLGIGAPGAVDFAERHASSSPPTWKLEGRAAQEGAGKATGRAGVRGERLQHLPRWASMWPNSKPSRASLVGIFVGTGIGGGLILNGELLRRLQPYRRGNRAHGPGSQRPQMRLRQQGLLRGPGQPHRHLPADQGRRQRRPKDPPHRNARRRPERPAQRRPAQGHPPRRQIRRDASSRTPPSTSASPSPTSSTSSTPKWSSWAAASLKPWPTR